MKIKTKHLVVFTTVLTAAIMNPSLNLHKTTLIKGLMRIDLDADQHFLEKCEFYNYGLFSFTVYLGKPVSFGVFGNVHIFYSTLESSMQDYYIRHSVIPNLGRGTPIGEM
ncbi:MAG: hypothetical protein IPK76_26070 [Lewinellaceae bacterium]|jgi:hypothetical protein|nr:hypothetical protein [Lewinellaceae bacterium]